jgi:hypothetical protein
VAIGRIAFAAVLSIAVLPAAAGQAKQKPGVGQTPPKIVVLPVSEHEAADVLARVESAIARVVLRKSTMATPSANASRTKPVDRHAVIRQLFRLFQMSKSSFKFTPRKVVYNAAMITIPASKPERKMVETLIAWSFLGKVSPLATSKTNELTLEQFGDAIGYFVSRMADVTHTPSSQWSPYMQRVGG